MNKRGGAIVESVMVLPVVVMSVVIVIYMMIYFYLQICERVDMHMLLRAESGIICENMFYSNNSNSKLPVYKETQQIYSIGVVEFDRKLLLKGKNKEISSRKYLVDEVKFVRTAGILND